MADYSRWHTHYYTHSGYVQGTQSYLKEKAQALGLDKATSLISIGAGEGVIDSFLVKNCCPTLVHYIGVEPDQVRRAALSTAMGATCPQVKVTLVGEALPGWSGPPHPVDIILLCHSLYYIPDRVAAVKQCASWLRPGGAVILLLSLNDTVFHRIANEYDDCLTPAYDYNSLHRDVTRAGLPFNEETQMVVPLPSHFEDDGLLRMYFEIFVGHYPQDQMAILIERFKELQKNGDCEHIVTTGTMCIQAHTN